MNKDKKVKSVMTKQMIREFYTGTIKRVIGFYFSKAVNEILGTLTVSSKGLRAEKIELLKNEIMLQTLKTDKCKQILLFELDSLILRKIDIIAEILKQYGISNQVDATQYHDEMLIIFSEVISLYSSYVSSNRHDLIFKDLDD